jgi:O-antigen ligase
MLRLSSGQLQQVFLYALILALGLGEVGDVPILGDTAHLSVAEVVVLLLLVNSAAAGLVSGFPMRRLSGDPSSVFLLLWLCSGFLSILINHFRGRFAYESLVYWGRFSSWAMVFWVARAAIAKGGANPVTLAKLMVAGAMISLVFLGLEIAGVQIHSRPVWVDFSISKQGGSFRNPTSLGAYLSIGLGVCFALMHSTRTRRTLLGVVSICVMLGMLMTFSRAVLLEIFVVGSAFWAMSPRRTRTRVLISMAALGIVLLCIISVRRLGLRNIALATAENVRLMTVGETDVQTRIDIWRMIGRITLHHPFVGIGTRNYKLFFTQLTARYMPSIDSGLDSTHNFPLQVLVEQGVLGLSLYLLFLLSVFAPLLPCLRHGSRLLPQLNGESLVGLGMLSGMCGMLFGELFEGQTVSVLVISKFLVLGILDGFRVRALRRRGPS